MLESQNTSQKPALINCVEISSKLAEKFLRPGKLNWRFWLQKSVTERKWNQGERRTSRENNQVNIKWKIKVLLLAAWNNIGIIWGMKECMTKIQYSQMSIEFSIVYGCFLPVSKSICMVVKRSLRVETTWWPIISQSHLCLQIHKCIIHNLLII